MAREYIRPEVDKAMLKEIHGRRVVLVDPSLDDVLAALEKVQKRSSKNLVPPDEARRLWQAVIEQGEAGAWAGQWSCPAAFQYGQDGTVVQLVRLGREHVGCVIERQKLAPGAKSAPPIDYNDKDSRRRNSERWHEQAMAVFWTHLADAEIEAIRRAVV